MDVNGAHRSHFVIAFSIYLFFITLCRITGFRELFPTFYCYMTATLDWRGLMLSPKVLMTIFGTLEQKNSWRLGTWSKGTKKSAQARSGAYACHKSLLKPELAGRPDCIGRPWFGVMCTDEVGRCRDCIGRKSFLDYFSFTEPDFIGHLARYAHLMISWLFL